MNTAQVSILRKSLVVATLLGSVDASANTPALPEPDPAHTQLIIVRTKAYFGGWISARVLVDEQEVTKLGSSRYTIISVEPGKHKIEMILGVGSVVYAFTAEAGKQKFLNFSTDISEGHLLAEEYEVTWFIRELAREAALPLLAECKLQKVPPRKKSRSS